MKLKKIVSLAAAALMAVSMLAGCAEGKTENTQNNTQPTENTSIVSVVNATIKNNKAGITFGSDANFTQAVKKVVDEKGTNTTDDNLATALYAELEIDSADQAAFESSGLNLQTEGTKESVVVYKFTDENDTSISAAYRAAAKVYDAVNGMKVDYAWNGNHLYEYTYSDAYVAMVEVPAGDSTYYIVAVHLTCETKDTTY